MPSHHHFRGDPSTFPAHTTVVIVGLYQTVQVSHGKIFEVPFFGGLLEVPVFAATVFPGMVRVSRQNDEAGRRLLSESMRFII